MLRPALLAAASAALVALAAGQAPAADIARAPVLAPPPVACGAPVVLLPPASKHKHTATDYDRIYTVTPYDPGCPAGSPAGIYVPPQTAYLASSPTRYTKCVWPCIDRVHKGWYDGKLWYYDGGTPNRPDVFMILERN